MDSPWVPQTTRRRPEQRPWMGMALLLAVPLLSLVLIRMLWSESTLWFLIAGILMLGSAAVIFFARRDGPAYGYPTLSPEPNRLPLVFLGLGALFLALLILPNFSSDSQLATAGLQPAGSASQLANSQPTAQPTAGPQLAQRPQATFARATPTARARTAAQDASPTQRDEQASASQPPAGSQVYVVQDGDTLWDIAEQFNTTVDDILAANSLDNASNLQLGDEIVIPPSSAGAPDTAAETDVTPTR